MKLNSVVFVALLFLVSIVSCVMNQEDKGDREVPGTIVSE